MAKDENRSAADMNHPYCEYERTGLWAAIEAAVADLEQNRDIELSTAREYVVGYLCQQLAARHVVAPASLTGE